MLEFPRPKSSRWIAQLERPQKITGLLEVRAYSQDLMDQVLHTHNSIFTQVLLDDLVVGEGNTLLVDLAVATLVDEVADSLEGGVAIGDVRFDDFEHFGRGFCKADEHAVVDLEETEELEDFARFGGDLVNTGDLILAGLIEGGKERVEKTKLTP